MSGASSDLEKKLNELAQTHNQEPSWKKFFDFRILVVFSWLILLIIAIMCIYTGASWSSTSSEVESFNNRIQKNKIGLDKTLQEKQNLLNKLSNITDELSKTRQESSEWKAKNGEIQGKIDTITKDIANLENSLKDVQRDLEQVKGIHSGLVNEDNRLQKELSDATKTLEEVKAQFTLVSKTLAKWKMASGFGFIGTAFFALYDFSVNARLWQSREELNQTQAMQQAFPLLSPKFENYAFWKSTVSASVHRTECFRGRNKADLKRCVGQAPTLTTITTNSGYKFGVLLTMPWTTDYGGYEDTKAFAFSDNHAEIAQVKKDESSFVVNAQTLIQFGKSDIVISLDGRTGTARAESFNIPSGYNRDYFFHNGYQFSVKEVVVEVITFS